MEKSIFGDSADDYDADRFESLRFQMLTGFRALNISCADCDRREVRAFWFGP